MKKQEPKTIQIPEGYMAKINGDKIEFIKLAEPRWRAKYGGTYYFVCEDCRISCRSDYLNSCDTERYEAGNYFETAEEAAAAAKVVEAALKKFHEENQTTIK